MDRGQLLSAALKHRLLIKRGVYALLIIAAARRVRSMMTKPPRQGSNAAAGKEKKPGKAEVRRRSF
jgi:hypothetical protein